jgi:hypothetical protein
MMEVVLDHDTLFKEDHMSKNVLSKFRLDENAADIVANAKSVIVPESRAHILDMATGNGQQIFKVNYEVEGLGLVEEVEVVRCKNGVSVNYVEAYMRRRDPNCMFIGDNLPTDKLTYKEKFGENFEGVRQETFEWLKTQDLIVLPFISGDAKHGGYESILIGPKNAAFFTGGLADLQGFIPADEVRDGFEPKAVIYLAPVFRHTHYDGKQVVVHNRLENLHEVYSFNLYPGPSAKKGVYGILLSIGEKEGWITAHASTVRVTTPYDNSVVIMHEGASGGGKSEMIEEVHRESDGSVLLGVDLITEDSIYLELGDTCELHPVTDDMALCHPSYQNGSKLVVTDAEAGWFLRFDHIKEYGTSIEHEKLTIHPPEPLIFLNMDGAPDSTVLIWEHKMDAPGSPCPNPRVIMPRHFVPDVISEPVEVDIRSFGVRTPPLTKDKITYGIVGLLHILPPALAWLWRLVAPRGHANPSIVDSGGMSSEGVGSYWPFATGKMVTQANLLLEQIQNTPNTKYVLIPNQHIGSYKVGFIAEWLDREYLARKGSAKFRPEQLVASRCSTLGYSPKSLRIDGHNIPKGMLRTNHQINIGDEAYDAGAKLLTDFFKNELIKFNTEELNPLGRQIIDAYMRDATVEELEALMPM